MISPQRQEIITSLSKLSELAPEMRFGQLIANLTALSSGQPWEEVLWDLEDDQLVNAIRQMKADLAERAAVVSVEN